jgi:hypothetical protein
MLKPSINIITSKQKHLFICLIGFWSILFIKSQSWEFDEAIQFIRPRFFTRSYGLFPYSPKPNGSYQVLETGATFPVKHKFEVGLNKNFLGNLLQKKWGQLADIKAYTLFGALQAGVRQSNIIGDTIGRYSNYFIQGSMGGLHLTRKFRIFFWQAQAHVFTEYRFRTFPGIFSGVAGLFHLYGIRKYLYYGLAIAYFKSYPIPIAFFGGQYPLNANFNLLATLPYRIGIQYIGNGFSITTGIRPSGMLFVHSEPYGYYTFYRQGLLFNQARIKLGKGIFLWAEASWAFASQFLINEIDYIRNQSGIYYHIGLTFTGGKTLLEKLSEQIFK